MDSQSVYRLQSTLAVHDMNKLFIMTDMISILADENDGSSTRLYFHRLHHGLPS